MSLNPALRLVSPGHEDPVSERLVTRTALPALGWDESLLALLVVEDAPVYGGRFCAASNCEHETNSSNRALCRTHALEAERKGITSPAEFVRLTGRRRLDELYVLCRVCNVEGATRQATRFTLCDEHARQFHYGCKGLPRLDRVDAWLTSASPDPLPTLGLCAVSGCERVVANADERCCRGHVTERRVHCRAYGVSDSDEVEFRRWCAVAELPASRFVPFWMLNAHFRTELLEGLAATSDVGGHVPLPSLRGVIRAAAESQCTTLDTWRPAASGATTGVSAVRILAKNRQRALSGPESERGKDVWDLRVWGCRKGLVNFTRISQPWLRELVKDWAWADVPTREPSANGASTIRYVLAMQHFSASLAARPDGGAQPDVLGRTDVERFLDHMQNQVLAGSSPSNVSQIVQRVRAVLAWGRETGRLDPATCGYSLAPAVAIRSADCPPRSASKGRATRSLEEDSGRPFTTRQVQALIQALDAVEEEFGFRARAYLELLLLTGRRPSEIINLTGDCLREHSRQREDGQIEAQPVLHYYASKVRRWHSLFIDPETAALLQRLVDMSQTQFPDTEIAELRLFPSRANSRNGRRAMNASAMSRVLGSVLQMPGVSEAMADRERTVLYDFRHTFAQRHADAGVPIDVLQDLMAHVSSDTTRVYFDVTAERRADAVEVMRRFRFSRDGILLDTGEQDLLRLEQQRAGLAGVAVPLGECSHPSMLRPDDHGCPVRFRCLGCSQFSTSVDRLPELQAYLDELLASRETILAGDLLDEWAAEDAMPHAEEIDLVQQLCDRARDLLSELPGDERVQVEEAITVYRGLRDSALRQQAQAVRVDLRRRAGQEIVG